MEQENNSIAIFVDPFLNHSMNFLKNVTDSWKDKVVIISLENDRFKLKKLLKEHNVSYHEIIIISSIEELNDVIKQENIKFSFNYLLNN
jgi:hypothetical protein